jgi:hypothetical protein
LRVFIGLGAALTLAACGPAPQRASSEPASAPSVPVTPDYPLVEPIPPGQPGGLPDDRTPISEAPFTPTSPQGATNQMQLYFALIGEKKFDQAWELWNGEPTDQANATGMTKAEFVADMNRYYQYSAQVGAPGETDGAEGSIFITVPVQIYGRLKTGEAFHHAGAATLRRVNDVDGSTERQRQWHISKIETTPYPG